MYLNCVLFNDVLKKTQANSTFTFYFKGNHSTYLVRNKITQAGKTLPLFYQAFISS